MPRKPRQEASRLPFYHYQGLIAEREALAEDARIRARYDLEALEEVEEHEAEIRRLKEEFKVWREEHPHDSGETQKEAQRPAKRVFYPRFQGRNFLK